MKYIRSVAFALALGMSGVAPAAIIVTSDPILFWNERATTLMGGGPPAQTRAYAMMNVAMFDAVNSVLGGPNRFYTSGVSGSGGDIRAAVSQAAFGVMSVLDAPNIASYQAALASSLALVDDPAAKALGIATGAAYADAVLSMRSTDRSNMPVPYVPTGAPGDYALTGAGNAAVPHWGDVTPFVMSSGDQFRASPPPALDSAEYAAAFNEVKEIGSATSATRTPDQTASALFWDAANGSPWMRIGLAVAEDEGLSTLDNARTFSLLSTGLADALIAGFDSKYEHRLWRPVTAIREGDLDGNAATEADPGWNSLFAAPLHPSYVSTHSTLSGVGATILSSAFGDDEGFTITIAGDTRSFTGLVQAARDGADSRLWGGIHFRFDNEAGLLMGRQIARNALASGAFGAVPEPASWALMISGFALVGAVMRRPARKIGFA
jgi:hypothetical protein